MRLTEASLRKIIREELDMAAKKHAEDLAEQYLEVQWLRHVADGWEKREVQSKRAKSILEQLRQMVKDPELKDVIMAYYAPRRGEVLVQNAVGALRLEYPDQATWPSVDWDDLGYIG